MPQKNYKKQIYLITTVIVLSVAAMIAAVVAIIISATSALPADSGVNVIPVGNYIGKQASEISDGNLKFEYVDVYSEAPGGTVVDQSIPAGNQVATGTTVTLNVSKGSSAVEIPPVVNLHEDDAEKLLSDNGFTVIIQYIINSSNESAGMVVEVSPSSGTSVAFGSTVILKVYGTENQTLAESTVAPTSNIIYTKPPVTQPQTTTTDSNSENTTQEETTDHQTEPIEENNDD